MICSCAGDDAHMGRVVFYHVRSSLLCTAVVHLFATVTHHQ
jgi:hypothetical protein